MQLYNIKDASERVSFRQAVKQGLGRGQGLFFPAVVPEFNDIDELLALPLAERSATILGRIIGDELPAEQLAAMVGRAFNFKAPVVKVAERIHALELFHGPTLAFKDFGGRFMAQCLGAFADGEKITILTATSGDTGAAVAHAFYGMANIDVVVLYPKGKISPLQEKLFCTLGGNIHTLAVEGTFDQCQAMVKQAFDDAELRKAVGLNSANSINISRLLAQLCYYFEAVAQLDPQARNNLVVSVPSGNFGNLTAGLLAKAMGLPVKRFIAATNANDTVPRYLKNGVWQPRATVPTLANAMDVSEPNNWPRIEELCQVKDWLLGDIGSGMRDDAGTVAALRELHSLGYLCEPHGAIAYDLLKQQLKAGEHGLFLCTAHPAKFKESVEEHLGISLPLPAELAAVADKALLSEVIAVDFAAVKRKLLSLV